MTIKEAYGFVGELMDSAYGWHINNRVMGMNIHEFENKCEDLIRLLKAQEPRKSLLLVKNPDKTNGADHICGSCGGLFFHQRVNYCPWCGKEVKWE